jgi:hypothetical protein
VNDRAWTQIVNLPIVDIGERSAARVALNQDTVGWFMDALDPAACEHDVDMLSEHIMFCTKCGQVRQVELR